MINKTIPVDKLNHVIGCFIIITIVFLIALGPYLDKHFISTIILIPSLFLIAVNKDSRSFNKRNTELIFFFLLFLGGFFSIFYYTYYEDYLKDLKSILGAFLSAYIAISFTKNQDYSDYFFYGYIIAAILLIVIMYLNDNFSFTDFASRIDYRDRFLLNANAYSYFSYFANISLFFFHIKRRSFLSTIFLVLLPVLFIIIAFVTQSRGGLFLIIFINLAYWVIIHKPASDKAYLKFLKPIIFSLLIIYGTYKFISFYQNSRIKNRIESSSVGEDSRGLLIEKSFELFEQKPFFGVGLGQIPKMNGIGQFSHNSYIEILGEQGLFGGILLSLVFFIPLIKCLKLIIYNHNNPINKLLLLFLISFYFYNNLYVFYKYPFSMMFFFLMVGIINRIYYKTVTLVKQ